MCMFYWFTYKRALKAIFRALLANPENAGTRNGSDRRTEWKTLFFVLFFFYSVFVFPWSASATERGKQKPFYYKNIFSFIDPHKQPPEGVNTFIIVMLLFTDQPQTGEAWKRKRAKPAKPENAFLLIPCEAWKGKPPESIPPYFIKMLFASAQPENGRPPDFIVLFSFL